MSKSSSSSSESSRSSNSTKSPSRRSKVLRLVVILSVILAVLAVLGALFAKPIVRGWRTKQANSYGDKAVKLILDAETPAEMREAYELTNKGNRKDPDAPGVLRAYGEIHRRSPGSEDLAIDYYEKLDTLGAALPLDQLRLANLYFKVGKTSLVRDLLDKVRIADPANPRLGVLEERLAAGLSTPVAVTIQPGTPESVEDRVAHTLKGLDAKEALEIGRNQLSSRNAETREMGAEMIYSLAKRDDLAGIQALRILVNSRMPKPRAEEVIELLNAHPKKEMRDELLASSLKIRLEPQRRNLIIKEEVLKRQKTPLSELEDFFAWLHREGGAGWVLDLVDIEKAAKRPAILGVYLESLASENRWEDLDRILSSADLSISGSRRMLLQARVFQELKRDQSVVRDTLSGAIQRGAKEGNLGVVAGGVEMAEENNFPELVIMGLDLLKDNPGRSRSIALMGHYRVAARDRDSDAMLSAIKEVRYDKPENEDFMAVEAYLQLLKGLEIETASATAQELSNRTVIAEDRKLLRALAAYRFGDSYGAAELCKDIDEGKLPAGMRAVYAFLRAQAGGEEFRASLEICEGVPEQLCLQEENTFRRRVLGR